MSSRFGFSSLVAAHAPDGAAGIAVGDTEPDKFEGFMVPQGKASDKDIEEIDRVIWLRMDFIMNPRGWRIRYTSQGKCPFGHPTPTDRASLDAMIKDAKGLKRGRRKTTKRFKRPGEDGETTLSISGQKRQLVIITLSKNANVRFNRDGAAISTSWEHACSFLEAGVLTKNDQVVQYPAVNHITDLNSKNDKCRTAYFIIDPTIPSRERTSPSGFLPDEACSPPQPQPDGIPKAFNIHVDLVGLKKKRQGQSKPDECFIPIIIDPDVRHPGGFGGG